MNWPYRSQQDLFDADYRFRDHVPCPVCGAQIAIYQKPGEWPLFVDPKTVRPHIDRFRHADLEPVAPDGKSAAAGDR